MKFYSSRSLARHSRRLARHNPEEASLAKEAGMTLAATAVGVAAAVLVEKVLGGMEKAPATAAGATPDPSAPKVSMYTHNQVAVIGGVVGVLGGVGLHVKGIAPRVGKAFMAGSLALSAGRYIAHRKDTLNADGTPMTADQIAALPPRTLNSRGIQVAPVMVSGGAYGYLPQAKAAVGAQYGTIPTDAQY